MKIAYAISGYKQPEQFRWLLEAIHHPDDVFAVHVDAKSPAEVYRAMTRIASDRPNVHFLERRVVVRMGVSMLDQDLAAKRWLLEAKPDFDYVVNLSMQDYPLQPRSALVAFLESHRGRNFVSCRHRVDQPWHVRRRLFHRVFERKGALIKTIIPRVPPRDLKLMWQGSFWHALTREFAEWVVSDPKPERYRRYLRHALTPEEFFYQCVIHDSPFADTLSGENLHEVIWPERSSDGSPLTLGMEHLPHLLASNKFFARKFDCAQDEEVLRRLRERNASEVDRSQLSPPSLSL